MTRQRLSGRALRAPFGLSSHPTDEELLACLDGELDGRALTRIRSHLDACWGCRGRRDRLNQTIAAFVETRLEDSTRREGFPPSAASRLSARLDEVDARSTPPPVWRRTFWRMRAALAWRPTPARFAQACVAGLTIALGGAVDRPRAVGVRARAARAHRGGAGGAPAASRAASRVSAAPGQPARRRRRCAGDTADLGALVRHRPWPVSRARRRVRSDRVSRRTGSGLLPIVWSDHRIGDSRISDIWIRGAHGESIGGTAVLHP